MLRVNCPVTNFFSLKYLSFRSRFTAFFFLRRTILSTTRLLIFHGTDLINKQYVTSILLAARTSSLHHHCTFLYPTLLLIIFIPPFSFLYRISILNAATSPELFYIIFIALSIRLSQAFIQNRMIFFMKSGYLLKKN